jgi:transcriptional regulator with XRE-family HTH domain
MTGIKYLRTHFGLTQELLAAYLDISRSVLSMAESNKRDLTGTALLKLNELEMALLQIATPKDTKENIAAQQKIMQQLMEKEIKNLDYEITKQEKKLEECNKKYQQALLKTTLAGYIGAKPSLTKKDAAWLKILMGDAEAILKNNPATLQLMLQIKLKSMLQHRNDLVNYLQKTA